jgi:hypothetical protein
MTNPSSLLYDLTIASHHPERPGPIAHAVWRSTGIPMAVARQYIDGPLRDTPFLRGVTFIFAESVRSIVRDAGGSVEATVCPWSPVL